MQDHDIPLLTTSNPNSFTSPSFGLVIQSNWILKESQNQKFFKC